MRKAQEEGVPLRGGTLALAHQIFLTTANPRLLATGSQVEGVLTQVNRMPNPDSSWPAEVRGSVQGRRGAFLCLGLTVTVAGVIMTV